MTIPRDRRSLPVLHRGAASRTGVYGRAVPDDMKMISCLSPKSREGDMTISIRTILLKEGMPSVEQARARLQTELRSARQSGVKILKLIHGYGSSGIGGDLRISLQATLRQMAQQHEIGDCIYGENWRTSDERSWALLKRVPDLKSDSDLGKGNKGMTIVVL